MNNSVLTCNQHLFQAYNYFQTGQLQQSLTEYTQALKVTYSDSLKDNIRCTMSIIYNSLGNNQKSMQIMTPVLRAGPVDHSSISMIRILINMILMEMLQNKCTKAIDYFEMVLQIIQKESTLAQKQNLLEYATHLFFRVKNIQQISQYIQNMDLSGLRVEQIYSVSLMAFNSSVCNLQCQQKVQKKCYQQFIKHKRFDLAIFSLRSLIKFTKNTCSKQLYQKDLAKLVMMGYFNENIDFYNYESFETMKAITEQFIQFRTHINCQMQKLNQKSALEQSRISEETSNEELLAQWKLTIGIIMKQTNKNKQIENSSKNSILAMLQAMKRQQNMLVVRDLVKNNYFVKYHLKIQHTFKSLQNMFKTTIKNMKKIGFNHIKSKVQTNGALTQKLFIESKQDKVRVSINRLDRSKSIIKSKQEKQNNPPLGISIVSITSSKCTKEKDQGRKRIFEDTSKLNGLNKKVQKMIKLCEYGAFLNKRNYNSEGGEFKFVKITSSFIKWGKDPQKIQNNCQIYPLKDIKSIVYGRVSPNLNQNCNKMLSYSKCFSLLLQKRTLDFYCKNYEELQSWVCGISATLKKQNMRVVGYTPGKLRWKKMFAILKQNFIEPLKRSERNKYYYQNAYALSLFASNGYKLPNKSDTK